MGRSLWIGRCGSVTGRSLSADRCGSVAVGLAMSRSLWVGCSGLIAVGRSLSFVGLSACMSPPDISPVYLYMCLPCICVFYVYVSSYVCVFHILSQNNCPRTTISKLPS